MGSYKSHYNDKMGIYYCQHGRQYESHDFNVDQLNNGKVGWCCKYRLTLNFFMHIFMIYLGSHAQISCLHDWPYLGHFLAPDAKICSGCFPYTLPSTVRV